MNCVWAPTSPKFNSTGSAKTDNLPHLTLTEKNITSRNGSQFKPRMVKCAVKTLPTFNSCMHYLEAHLAPVSVQKPLKWNHALHRCYVPRQWVPCTSDSATTEGAPNRPKLFSSNCFVCDCLGLSADKPSDARLYR